MSLRNILSTCQEFPLFYCRRKNTPVQYKYSTIASFLHLFLQFFSAIIAGVLTAAVSAQKKRSVQCRTVENFLHKTELSLITALKRSMLKKMFRKQLVFTLHSRRGYDAGGVPIYTDSVASGEIAGEKKCRKNDFLPAANSFILLVAPPADPAPGDLISLKNNTYRISESVICRDLDGKVRASRCVVNKEIAP
jgi:hypothetical protein